MVRSILAPLTLDEELVIEQAPPQNHLLPDQLFLDLIPGAVDRYLGIGPTVRRSGSRAKVQNRSQLHIWRIPVGGEIGEPILHPGMRLRAVGLLVIAQQEVDQPGIGFLFVLGRMKVIERLVDLFDGPKRPLHFAFGPTGHPAAPLARGMWQRTSMSRYSMTRWNSWLLSDGPIVQIETCGRPRNGKPSIVLGVIALKRKRSAAGTLRRRYVIFLIGDAAAIVHDAVEHQDRGSPAFVDPRGWLREVLEIGGADIELPAFVLCMRLEVDRRVLDGQRRWS